MFSFKCIPRLLRKHLTLHSIQNFLQSTRASESPAIGWSRIVLSLLFKAVLINQSLRFPVSVCSIRSYSTTTPESRNRCRNDKLWPQLCWISRFIFSSTEVNYGQFILFHISGLEIVLRSTQNFWLEIAVLERDGEWAQLMGHWMFHRAYHSSYPITHGFGSERIWNN